MAKGIRNSNIKIALFLFFLLFLPLVVFYASDSKLNEIRSRAVSLVGEGGCSEDEILYQRYKIKVTGIKSCGKKRIILDAIFNAYSYPGLRDKLGSDPLEFRNLNNNSENMGYTFTKNLIKLYRFENRGTEEEWKFIITHELFHLLSKRNRSILEKYDYQTLSRSDPKCFKKSTGSGQFGNC